MPILYCSTKSGGVDIPEPYDPNAILDYSFLYKPNQYKVNTQYSRFDVVLPTVFSGFYFECIDSGISGSVEPTWPTDLGMTLTDNTVTWKSREYNWYLDPAEGIEVNGLGGYLSTWTATNGVTVGNNVATDRATKIWVLTVPVGVTKFSITNKITTTTGRTDDRTVNIKVINR